MKDYEQPSIEEVDYTNSLLYNCVIGCCCIADYTGYPANWFATEEKEVAANT